MSIDYESLRLKDLKIIRELALARSIRELARRLRLDPQNLTKRISNIESALGVDLMDRSVSGYALNSNGTHVVREVSALLERLESLRRGSEKSIQQTPRFRFCSRGFLVEHFIRDCLPSLPDFGKKYQFDFMDSSPALTERAARDGLLEVVLHFGDVLLGANWFNEVIGTVTWGVYVRQGHPLLKASASTRLEAMKKFPHVGFCYFESGQVMSEPNSNLAKSGSSLGSCAENTRYSRALAEVSDQIIRIPKLSAARAGEPLSLVELKLGSGEGQDSRMLYLGVNQDRVSQKLARDLKKLASAAYF